MVIGMGPVAKPPDYVLDTYSNICGYLRIQDTIIFIQFRDLISAMCSLVVNTLKINYTNKH